MEDVFNVINSLNILDDKYVVLACSYGPDSMCLLDILRKCNLNIVVAHVNHKLRKESDKEYTDLEKYCKDNNLIFEGTIITEEPTGNLEEYYRKFRYNFFKEIINKYKAEYLFTAHHGDDLIETILMRLSRGSSFKGYSGFNMITKTNDYTLVRPLIYLTKDEILLYVKNNNIPYAIDETNFKDDYTRNKYRNNILPLLKEINPKIHKKFIKFSHTINEYNDYIEKEVDNLYSQLYLNNRLDLNDFNVLPILLKKNLLNKILYNIYGNSINNINDKHLKLILDLVDNDKKNSSINLPNNIIVIKYYNILEFTTYQKQEDYFLEFNNKLVINNFTFEQINQTDIIKSNYLIRLNSNSIKLPLYIRNRKIGDKIELKNGTKKIGEILSESKLAKKERDKYPLVIDSEGKILWIPGIKKSKFDIEKDKEYDIIIKCIKKGEKNEKEK